MTEITTPRKVKNPRGKQFKTKQADEKCLPRGICSFRSLFIQHDQFKFQAYNQQTILSTSIANKDGILEYHTILASDERDLYD